MLIRHGVPQLKCTIRYTGSEANTVLENSDDVANALHRPVDMLREHFQAEYGCTTCIVKGRVFLGAAYTPYVLDTSLSRFTSSWVLCPACRSTKTSLVVRKGNDVIYNRCHACKEITRIQTTGDRAHVAAFLQQEAARARLAAKFSEPSNEEQEAIQLNYALAASAVSAPSFAGDVIVI